MFVDGRDVDALGVGEHRHELGEVGRALIDRPTLHRIVRAEIDHDLLERPGRPPLGDGQLIVDAEVVLPVDRQCVQGADRVVQLTLAVIGDGITEDERRGLVPSSAEP